MSQLVVRPGRNAARQAKKLKEIRHVKAAIQWHERERKERQKIHKERYDAKQVALQTVSGETAKAQRTRQTLKDIKEDWRLGPLRPNRILSKDPAKYGTLNESTMQKPEIPASVQKNRLEYRAKKGLELEYPLVVDDKKYFPIVKDDRVVILKGKDKGRIGVVQEVIGRVHEITVKGMNMQYYDSDVFSKLASEGLPPKRSSEVPLAMSDVRLVVPYELTQDGLTGYRDVIVENIYMERHTTGIDPFTGTNYGSATIPEEHQYDPQTGLPIFYRYIAGTQHRIEWPWEISEAQADATTQTSTKAEEKSLLSKTWGVVRHPITSLKGLRKASTSAPAGTRTLAPAKVAARAAAKRYRTHEEELADRKAELLNTTQKSPHSQIVRSAPTHSFIDSTRNVVEAEESVRYTLLSPEFPESVSEELRDDIHNFTIEAQKAAKKDPDAPAAFKVKRTSPVQGAAQEQAKQHKRAIDSMKTPMQLRWELDQATKLAKHKKSPLVQKDALMLALGMHMQKNGIGAKKQKAKVVE